MKFRKKIGERLKKFHQDDKLHTAADKPPARRGI